MRSAAVRNAAAQEQPSRVPSSAEVTHLVNGERLSVRTLSRAAERRAGGAAAGLVLLLTCVSAAAVAAGLGAAGFAMHGPSYVALWAALGLSLAVVSARRARARSRRYVVGIDIDDDAYAPVGRALVRRARGGYRLALAPGMTGVVEGGRLQLSVDALVLEGATELPLEAGARAEVSMGATTFVVRTLAQEDAGAVAPLPRGFWRPFARRAMLPIALAGVVTFLRAVPAASALGEADMKSIVPADASPWEVEKLLRKEAQLQARTLHACFDPLPMSCQRAGYVGVGLSLSKQGEIRSSWIAQSTYGRECPVEACMSEVISGWFFDSIPEAMRIVLPVQVLRTDRPLPPAHASLDEPFYKGRSPIASHDCARP
jgi:hypothetical protein